MPIIGNVLELMQKASQTDDRTRFGFTPVDHPLIKDVFVVGIQ
jgi:hypothetical protein